MQGVMVMHKLATEEQFQEIVNQPRATVAVFKTAWCKDCHYIEPFMPEVVKKYEDRITFVELDRDQFPELGEKLNILGIPSFVAFREGQELIRFVSKLRKTREEIETFLDRVVEVADAMAK